MDSTRIDELNRVKQPRTDMKLSVATVHPCTECNKYTHYQSFSKQNHQYTNFNRSAENSRKCASLYDATKLQFRAKLHSPFQAARVVMLTTSKNKQSFNLKFKFRSQVGKGLSEHVQDEPFEKLLQDKPKADELVVGMSAFNPQQQ